MVIVAFLQVVAISVQALFLWLAFRATTMAAEAARDSADSSLRAQRPYLYITGIEFVPGDEIGATYRIENFGNTPAILQKSSTESKYPPAKPGALMSEPLKAAWRGLWPTPVPTTERRSNSDDGVAASLRYPTTSSRMKTPDWGCRIASSAQFLCSSFAAR
jgi:hypothetical protein